MKYFFHLELKWNTEAINIEKKNQQYQYFKYTEIKYEKY